MDLDAKLAAAACAVLTSVSEHNLRHGDTAKVAIPRRRLKELEQALEAGYPGYLAAVREAMNQNRED
jgi:hypothetical protein